MTMGKITNERLRIKAEQESLTDAFIEGRKAGRREVAEWFLKYGGAIGVRYSDGLKARFDPPWEELQAKLKSWGIRVVIRRGE